MLTQEELEIIINAMLDNDPIPDVKGERDERTDDL